MKVDVRDQIDTNIKDGQVSNLKGFVYKGCYMFHLKLRIKNTTNITKSIRDSFSITSMRKNIRLNNDYINPNVSQPYFVVATHSMIETATM